MGKVVIIGGGIIGLATAYYLALRSVPGVVLVERAGLASQSSSENAGCLWPSLIPGPRNLRRLASLSMELFEELSKREGFDFKFRRNGVLMVLLSQEEIIGAEGLVKERRKEGIEVKLLDGEEARDIEPALSEEVAGAVFCPKDGHGDCALLAHGLARRALEAGVKIMTGTEVVGLKARSGRVDSVVTEGGEVKADMVVMAAGPWSGSLARSVGVEVPVSPAKGYMLTTEPLPKLLNSCVSDGDVVVLQTIKGRARAGGTVEFAGFDADVRGERIERIWARARELVPGLEGARIVNTWAGLRPYSPDGLPILGLAPQIENLIVATGHFRNGLLLAPITGKLVAELMVEGKTSIDIEGLSPSRFTGKGG